MSQQSVREQAERYTELCGEYTNTYERDKLIADWIGKEESARTTLKDFERRAGGVSGKRVLELGFGSGLYIPAFAEVGAEIHGVEVNSLLLDIAQGNMEERGIPADLRLYDGLRLPYADDYFDYVFSVSVLEHVTDLRAVTREMSRVLKPGGRGYISFPNRFAPRETHTGFWFLHYLPRPAAAWAYARLGSSAVEDINLHFLTYFSFRRALAGTRLRILPETDASTPSRGLVKRALAGLGLHFSILLKTIMVIVEKREPQ